MQEQSHFKPALLVFLAAFGLLWFFISDRLRLNIDEGIYLDGALEFEWYGIRREGQQTKCSLLAGDSPQALRVKGASRG